MPGKSVFASALAVVLLTLPRSSQGAVPLLGAGYSGPAGAVLYDVNPTTGAVGNPRPTGINYLVGIAFSTGNLYGLSASAAASNPNSLYTINQATGQAQWVGTTGLFNISEGDLATDPTTGVLYGLYDVQTGARKLFALNANTAAATVLPGSLPGDPSAMAFDSSGMLFVLDTSLQRLLTVNKTTGATLTDIGLSASLGATAGMAFDPATGVLYVSDGESGGTNRLYTLNTVTGVLGDVGPTGLANGRSHRA
jgi:DNA-binding beta-propeller fold protein YncE